MIRNCVVVGGGIGGLSVARALGQRGIDVKVFERAPFFVPTAGAGFGFSPNGQACLRSIGVDVKGIGHVLENQFIYNRKFTEMLWEGDTLGRIGRKYGLPLSGTLRADLIDLLASPLLDNGVLHYSHEVKEVRNSKEKATVVLTNGEEFETDLVIGADGISSTVLRSVFEKEDIDSPVFSNENIFYGIIEDGLYKDYGIPNLGLPGNLVQQFGCPGEFISFPAGNDGTMVWAQTYSSKEPPSTEEWGNENCLPALENLMKRSDFPSNHILPNIVKMTNPDRILHFGLNFREHKKRWSLGRVCLLGDSCHATLPYVGQGANQAIEDSVVLADCLATKPGEEGIGVGEQGFGFVEKALQNYYDRRHKRTKRIVDMAHFMAKAFHPTTEFQAWGAEKLMYAGLKSGVMFRVMEKEIVDDCPVKVPVVDSTVKV
mmetsp:Transcript_38879/g.54209  ORF Transcript_38879/g.54209 Transcript_38879/m.54209 type:complete len:430 (-) Transcript_38879:8-1297(-)